MRELKGKWTDLFNGFSVALDVKKLLLGFIALTLSIVIIFGAACILDSSIWDHLVNRDVPLTMLFKHSAKTLAFTADSHLPSPADCHPSPRECVMGGWTPLKCLSGLTFQPYAWYVIPIVYLLLVIIWAYFGGAISRTAAVNLTKDEGLELGKSLKFTGHKYLAFLSPWIITVLGFLFFFGCNVLGGLVGRIPYAGELLVGLGIPLAILSGFIMVFILIGFRFASPMFYGTIAVESSDSFDAISRSFQYLYARPWHYIWYHLVAIVYGLATFIFVGVFTHLMVKFALKATQLGMGDKLYQVLASTGLPARFTLAGAAQAPHAEGITMVIAAFIIAVVLILVYGFMVSYLVSYYFSSYNIIYLLMRKNVDEIDMKELYDEDEEKEDETPVTPAASTEAKPSSGADLPTT
ncbi:MAG: hypothetical protein HY762_06785 [Planctomycetes bacterium]|nr:hypothetical protein [Planctomycetota bacterium]